MTLLTLIATATMLNLAAADDPPLTTAEQVAIAEKTLPSIVRVEFTFRYDKGEAPRALGWAERCPNCGQYHGQDVDSLIREERPLELAGFLIASNRVVCGDPLVHPRFVKEIAARLGNQRIPARITGVDRNQTAVFMELSEPFKDASPLVFDPKREGPYLAVTCARANGAWTTTVQPFTKNVSITEQKDRYCAATANAVVVDRKGTPVTLRMNPRLPVDDSWKLPPDQWPVLSAEEKDKLLETIQTTADNCVLHVLLRFRSAKKAGGSSRWSYHSDSDDEEATERHTLGVLTDRDTLLVLASLSPRLTARLQRIQVYPPKGEPVNAKFAHSLKDYGCLIAKLDQPMEKPAALRTDPITQAQDHLLLYSEVKIHGDKRVAYLGHTWIPGFEVGWKGQTYPEMRGDAEAMFLFDGEGRLWAMPVRRRPKLSVRNEWSTESPLATPAEYLDAVLRDIGRHRDPNNVPLGEEDENRLAWLGVELQALDKELARVNQVSELTQDGQSGALVTHVYPDSPAAKAGIEAGLVLLRLHVPGHPKPVDIQLDGGRYGFMEGFPWDQLENMPVEYMADLPAPWPSAENKLTRTLTDLGAGQPYTAEFARNGQTVTKNFEVVMGPRTFESALRFKSEPLGLTVRDLTYEVRRHLQIQPEDPGVIVAKIEQGSKSAVAGVRPYEVITHVNAKPINDAKEFEKAIAGGDSLRLSVKRKTKGREVIIRMTGPAEKKNTASQSVLRRLWSTTSSQPGDE